MKNLVWIFLMLISMEASARQIKIAVIDSGYTKNKLKIEVPLCKEGHIDFSGFGDPFSDQMEHGTHVSGVIKKYALDSDFCIVVIKYIHSKSLPMDTLSSTIRSINHAIDLKVDFINYSGGGFGYSSLEKFVIEKAQQRGITFISAAGNESMDLRKMPYYPGCYNSKIVMVASTDSKKVLQSSNYFGKDKITKKNACDNHNLVLEAGLNVGVELKGNKILYMTGTSQATAVVTGKIVYNSYSRLVGRK